MKTLAELIPYGTVEEFRAAYRGTPRAIRELFTDVREDLEGDGWMISALQAGDVKVMTVLMWVANLGHVSVPSIRIDPWKGPGYWRVSDQHSERYVETSALPLYHDPDR